MNSKIITVILGGEGNLYDTIQCFDSKKEAKEYADKENSEYRNKYNTECDYKNDISSLSVVVFKRNQLIINSSNKTCEIK